MPATRREEGVEDGGLVPVVVPELRTLERVVDPHGLFRDLYEKTVLAPRGLSRDGRRP